MDDGLKILEVDDYDYKVIEPLLMQLVESIYGNAEKGMRIYEELYQAVTFYKNYQKLKTDDQHIYFVFFDDELVGFFFMIEYSDRDYVYLVDIVINKKHRGKGIGRKIISFIEKEFSKDIVTEAHPGSLEFFLSNGFEIESEAEGKDGILWYKMKKRVSLVRD